MSRFMKELKRSMEAILDEEFGFFNIDDQGDYYVDKKGFRVFITPWDMGRGETLIRVWTVAAYGVEGRKKLLAYLNELNRRATFGSFYYKNGMVYVSQTIMGGFLDTSVLKWTVKGISKMAKQIDKLMVRGFGGSSYDWDHDFGSSWYFKPYSLAEYGSGFGSGGLFLSAVIDDDFRESWAWAFDDGDVEYDEFFGLMESEPEYVEESMEDWDDEYESDDDGDDEYESDDDDDDDDDGDDESDDDDEYGSDDDDEDERYGSDDDDEDGSEDDDEEYGSDDDEGEYGSDEEGSEDGEDDEEKKEEDY